MTRKDFVVVAAALKASHPGALHPAANIEARNAYNYACDQWRRTCRAVAGALVNTNARFDSERFLAACGVET